MSQRRSSIRTQILLRIMVCLILVLSTISYANADAEGWRQDQLRKLDDQRKAKLETRSPQLESLEKVQVALINDLVQGMGVSAGSSVASPTALVAAAKTRPEMKGLLDKIEENQKQIELEKRSSRDVAVIDSASEKLKSLSPTELNFAYQKDYVVQDAQNRYNIAEQQLKISPNNPVRRAARDKALADLQSARKAMYGLEKDSRIAQYDREARQAGEKKGVLVQESSALQEELDAELNKPSPDDAKIKELQSKLSKISSDVESLSKAESQAQARVRYLKGEAGFAQTLTEVVEAYNEFAGMGAFTSLFIDDKELQKRRDEANDLFCQSMLLGGVECWTSKLCEANADANIGGLSLIARTPQQDPRAAAHVEADVSLPISYINQTTKQSVTIRLYRITYYLNNPSDVNMSYNLIFKKADGSEYAAFGSGKVLDSGGSDSKLRSNAIVKYSGSHYREVCLTFNLGIKRFGGGTSKELCAPIVEYAGGPTTIAQSGTGNQSSNVGNVGSQQSSDFGGF